MSREEIEARIAELDAAIAAYPYWGAALGAMDEERSELQHKLRYMDSQAGFVTYLAIGIVLLLSLLFAVGRHHNGGGTSREDAEVVFLEEGPVMGGCQGSMADCSAAPIPEPASGLLIAVGGIVVGYAVRKGNKS